MSLKGWSWNTTPAFSRCRDIFETIILTSICGNPICDAGMEWAYYLSPGIPPNHFLSTLKYIDRLPENSIIEEMEQNTILKNWVTDYADDLFRRALYLTSHRETAEDLVQETFLAAAQQLEHFGGKSSPRTWLYAILKNKVADHFRERYRKMPDAPLGTDAENDFFTPEGAWRPEAMPAEWDDSPANLLDNPNFGLVLEGCLGHLPRTWHDVVVLKFLEARKGIEICQELGITTTNFWQILHRAKLQLRLCLEQHWFQH